MIDVQSLSRYYGKTAAVENVSFHIPGNEIVGLLGHNGAGKTTMMRMLSGYLEPSSGHISIQDTDITVQPQAIQQFLGYLPENLPVYTDMWVADYLEYAATLKGIPSSRRSAAIKEAIVSTDLQDQALQTIGALSRGMKQRVGVAQAILGSPQLLILDEPTNGLDPAQTQQMRQLILRLARKATVILSTHIMQEVRALCSRVLVLENGQLVMDRYLEDIYRAGTLQLTTDNSAPALSGNLQMLPQVEEVTESQGENDQRQFTLRLVDEADMDGASADVARCVLDAGARLYQLHVEERDLDSLFDEVKPGGD